MRAAVIDPPRSVEPEPARRARLADREVLALAALTLLLAALLQVTPDRQGVTLFGWRLPESCAAKRLAGHPCPGCGLTRSFVLGVRADPEAFRLHPLGPLLLVIVAAQVPYRLARLRRARRLERAGLVDLRVAEGAARPTSGWSARRLGGHAVLAGLIVVWVVKVIGGGGS